MKLAESIEASIETGCRFRKQHDSRWNENEPSVWFKLDMTYDFDHGEGWLCYDECGTYVDEIGGIPLSWWFSTDWELDES